MRGVLIALATIAFVHGAAAADYGGGPLRGTSVYELGAPKEPRWNGFYFGGQWSYASPSADFSNATAGMVAHLLRETTIENEGQVSAWTTLGKASTSVSGFGGFFGYNWQWEDVIVGVEANYTNSRATLDSIDSLTRMFSTGDGYSNNVTVTANAAVTMKDYLTVRGRFGYAFDRFLPYGMLGVAVGRADSVRAVTVVASGTYIGPPPIKPDYGPIALSQAENRDNIYTYGFSVGAGIDVAVVRNVFVRAEWEYLQFPNVNETRVNINTGRVAVGVKF